MGEDDVQFGKRLGHPLGVLRLGVLDVRAAVGAHHEHDGDTQRLAALIERENPFILHEHGGLGQSRFHDDAPQALAHDVPLQFLHGLRPVAGVHPRHTGKPPGVGVDQVHDILIVHNADVRKYLASGQHRHADARPVHFR